MSKPCCTTKATVFPLPPWVRPGVRVICTRDFSAGFETLVDVPFEVKVEVNARGTICAVDDQLVKVVGANAQYPTVQVQLLRIDFQSYWRKALPHEYGYAR